MKLFFTYIRILISLITVAVGISVASSASASLSVFSISDAGLDKAFAEGSNDNLGHNGALIGDINSDGYPDMAITAFGADYGFSNSGTVYVLYGSSDRITTDRIDISDDNVVRLTGEESNNNNSAVSPAGDVNNDGFDDFLIGASNNSNNTLSYNGAAYLIYGQSAKLTSESLGGGTNTITKITGEATEDSFGASVAGAGDVNGDGYDDILIGATKESSILGEAGAAYLIYGESDQLASEHGGGVVNLVTKLTGEAASDNASVVSTAGDINGDGYDDILVGAYNESTNGEGSGAAYLVYGNEYALASSGLDEDTNVIVKFTIDDENRYLGETMFPAGDLNNDGFDDVILNEAGHSAIGSYTGAIHIIYGESDDLTSGLLSSSANTITEINGEVGNSLFGNVVETGDVNDDGYDDLVVGATRDNTIDASSGAVYIIQSNAGSFDAGVISSSSNVVTKLLGTEAYDRLPGFLATDDIDQDGYNDIIMSSYTLSDGDLDGGALYYMYGQAPALNVIDNTTTNNTVECSAALPNYTASSADNYFGTELEVITSGMVNANTTGEYMLDYAVTNSIGLTTTSKRTVTVRDTTKPVINLVGESTIDIIKGDSYIDEGALASDSCDTNIQYNTVDTVDADTTGEYTVTYSATDAAGNTRTVTRQVNVTKNGKKIDTVSKSDNVLTVQYQDGSAAEMTPFGSKKGFRYTVSVNNSRIIATNGKAIKVFANGELVAKKKLKKGTIGKKKWYRLSVDKIYGKKSYESIVLVTAKTKGVHVHAIRLTANNAVKKYKRVKETIATRKQPTLTVNTKKKQIKVSADKALGKNTINWKLTKKGKLNKVTN